MIFRRSLYVFKKVLIHVIKWSYPEDIKRTVMLPYGAIMIFVNKDPFQILIKDYKKVVFSDRAIKSKMGYYFVIFMPDKRNFKAYQFLDLKITLYGDMIEQKNGKLLLLPRFQDDEIKNKFLDMN